MESFLLDAVLAAAGLIALYRRSPFSDLQDGMNTYVNDKDEFIGIIHFYYYVLWV